MKTSQSKQTQTDYNHTLTYLEDASTDKQTSRAPVFDPNNNEHKARLYYWCKAEWPTFCRSLLHQNSVYYHDCCSCFSKRRFSKLAGHPCLQTSSVITIPSFKEVESAADLFRWLLKMLTYNSKKGARCLFPAFNRYHIEEDSKVVQGRDDDDEESMFLNKRVSDLNRELSQVKHLNSYLQTENSKLLESSKSWFQRYQEISEGYQQTVPSELQTPNKANANFWFNEVN